MEKGLVSILTPCYNGEHYITRYLDSILSQKYRPLELILVNDGSIDGTNEIVEQYKSKFIKEKITFKYIVQKNGGQSKAINTALSVCEGEYLTWPDSDDILSQDNIVQKVAFLKSNPKYSMVMCRTRCVFENDLTKTIYVLERKNPYSGNLFEDFLLINNVYFAPGSFMVKAEDLFKALKGREIIESPVGQNWQLLLPMTYYYNCGFIDDILYTYVIRKNSHSRQEKNVVEILQKYNRQQDLLKHILYILIKNDEELNYYLNKLDDVYSLRRMQIYFDHGLRKEFNKEFRMSEKNLHNIIKFCLINTPVHRILIKTRSKNDIFS